MRPGTDTIGEARPTPVEPEPRLHAPNKPEAKGPPLPDRPSRRLAVEPDGLPLDVARWIVSHHVGAVDHACAECVPGGDMVIDGFRCVPHKARAVFARLGPSEDKP